MAPPNKRRRLSGPGPDPYPSHGDIIPEEPSPTLLHTIKHLSSQPEATHSSASTKRIQEIHFQIQERAVARKLLERPLYPRQAPAVTSTFTTTDALGQTTLVEVTIGATTTTPILPAGSGTSDSSESSSNSTSPSTDLSGSTALGNSHNATAAGHTSTKDSSKDSNSDGKTSLSSIYTATLSDHHVVTITRSEKSYTTTFADGESSIICASGDKQCILSSGDSTETPNNSIEASTPGATASTVYAAGSPAQGPEAAPSTSTDAAVQHSSDDSTPPPATIAGGVVGGAAGLAVILIIAMFLLRWYRRRRQLGHHALPPSSAITSEPDTPLSRGGPGMAERAGLRPLVNAVPAFFKHQNMSDVEPPPSERSFQKISGRKLPSAYSEGMSSSDIHGAAASIPSTAQDRNYSSLSFYRDSQGFYGGDGDAGERTVSPDEVPPLLSDNGGVQLSPGPGRRPTVHTGGPYIMSPSSSVPSTPNMQSPNLATIPGSPPDHPRNVNRSSTPSTVTDNRSSRFTEEV